MQRYRNFIVTNLRSLKLVIIYPLDWQNILYFYSDRRISLPKYLRRCCVKRCIVTLSKIFWQRIFFSIREEINQESCHPIGYMITSFNELKFVTIWFLTVIITFVTPPPLSKVGGSSSKYEKVARGENQHNLQEIECPLINFISATLDAFRLECAQIRPISGRIRALPIISSWYRTEVNLEFW